MRTSRNGSARPLTKAELRALVNAAARERFGVAADRLPPEATSGMSERGAAARRLAFAARYAKK